MSRYSSLQKEKTHQKIVSTASKMFRKSGYSNSGVQKVMRAVGLTRGGFYAHFGSKDDLFIEAISHALENMRKYWLQGIKGNKTKEDLSQIITRYISPLHRDNPDKGCALPNLAVEVGRSGKKVRRHFEEEFLKNLKEIDKRLPLAKNKNEQEQILSFMSLSVGSIILSRAVFSPELSNLILQSGQNLSFQIFK